VREAADQTQGFGIFTRQLATMMKAGVPLLQAFDIVGRGNPTHGSPSCSMTFGQMSKPEHH
jgi:type II secretory pathway component PulF